MSGIVGKNAGRSSGIVGSGDIGADAVDSANIADDAIDSEHYTDGSIDNAHIADDAIDSEHYADGSIDNAHIADDAIDSEHYAAASIDTAHIATNQIDETLMKDAFVGDFTDATVTASDYFLHGDATDSGNTKKDTVQGILDLAGGGGAWEHIGTTDASNVANIDFDSGTYTYSMADYTAVCFYFVMVYGNTASQKLQLDLSTDDGSNYLDNFDQGAHSVDRDGDIEVSGPTGDFAELTPTVLNSGAGAVNYSVCGSLYWPSHQSAATRAMSGQWNITFGDASDPQRVTGFFYTADAVDSGGIDAFRFFMTSGNITGRISMYGIKDS